MVYGVCMKYLADEDESQDVQMQVLKNFLKIYIDMILFNLSLGCTPFQKRVLDVYQKQKKQKSQGGGNA